MTSRGAAAAATVHYARLRPWTIARRPRGTIRGTTRRIIPAQWVPSVQWTVPSVQLAHVRPVSTLLVNGRPAVRTRSPAPRSEGVNGLCLSRLVERTLRAGAACRHSGFRYGRWRLWHPSSVGPHHDAMNAQPAEHPEDPQRILRELPDRERANFLAATGEPWTVREIRPDGDIRGGMLLGIASDCAVPRNQRHAPEPLAPGDDRHAGREVGHQPNGYCSSTNSLMVASSRKFGRYRASFIDRPPQGDPGYRRAAFSV